MRKTENMVSDVITKSRRPESVQAAFEVFQGKTDTGPHATAMFRYIEELEAAVQKEHAQFVEIGNRFVQAKFEAAKAREIALEGAVTVKPLKWLLDFAHTDFGLFYHISERGADLSCVLEKHTGSSVMKSFWPSVNEAKAAAQTDFEQRILSALVMD